MIICQAQSVSGLTSHLPFWDPPHGPFSSFLAQRVTGQIPPKMASLQSPQPAHSSVKTPCFSRTPIKVVLTPGNTGVLTNRLTSAWTPAPQARDNTPSFREMAGAPSWMNSSSHWRSTVNSFYTSAASQNKDFLIGCDDRFDFRYGFLLSNYH